MGFFAIAKKAASMSLEGVRGATEFRPPTQDVGLPYGGHIGALAQVNDAAFLVANMLGSIVEPPGTGEVVVKAISRVRMDGWPNDTQLHRYYLTTGDDGMEKERYIQVVSNSGVPREAMYFSSLFRLYPDSPDVIRFYNGEDEKDRIGGQEWFFARSDLEKWLNKSQLQTLGTMEELVYQRAVGDGVYHPPLTGVENRIDDAVGNTGLRQRLWCMPHVRALDTIQEHLVISLEIMDTHDGKREKEVHVDFMVGISIATTDFRII